MDSLDYYPKEVWKLAGNIAISSFIYCFGLVSMNSCTENIATSLNWGDSPLFRSIFTSLYPLGAMFGSILGSPVSTKIGMRRTILYSNSLFIFASFLSIIPKNFTFGTGRFLAGIVGGIFITIPTVFINEITPDPMTGSVGTLIQQACSSSFVASYFFGLFTPTENLSTAPSNSLWILIMLFPAVLSLYQIYYFSSVFKYENPKWLIKNGKEEEARMALLKIYKKDSVAVGIKRLGGASFGTDQDLVMADENPSFKDMFCGWQYRKMMRISLGLNIGQQTAGSAVVLMYSTAMFENMGGGKFFARVMTFVLGLVSLVSGLAAIPLIGRAGRKTILVGGTVGSALCLFFLGIFAGVDGGVGLKSGLIFLYVFIFTASMGATFWTYIGEVCNEKAVSIGLTFNFVTIITLSFCFPIALFYFGISVCFFALAGFAFVLAAYQVIDLVETMGLTKLEISGKIYSS